MSFLEEPLLLVPMHVDALAVGTGLPDSGMFQWTHMAPDLSKLQRGYHLAAELGIDPFEAAQPGLEPGIHLHFRLPQAFSHGRKEEASELEFPRIPNRWLVQRFGGPADAYKAWLIKSDALAPDDAPGVPWPKFPKDDQTPAEFSRIGAWTELTAPRAHGDESELTAPLADGDESAREKLTVVGQGNPVFGAHYPACRTVLGFHDPMGDVPKRARLSYLVTGWFSARTDDPLHETMQTWCREYRVPTSGPLSTEQRAKLFAALTGWLDGRQWTYEPLTTVAQTFRASNGIPIGDPLSDEQRTKLVSRLIAWLDEQREGRALDAAPTPPSRLLFHGLVRGIGWEGPEWNYMQPDGDAEVFPRDMAAHGESFRVAVGNTAGEALAALLVKGSVDQDLLTALQADLLGQPVTADALQFELHARRFQGVQGGVTFAIQPEVDQAEPGGAGDPNLAAGRQSNAVPRSLLELLEELNRKQHRLDDLARYVEDSRRQVYALWYLWTGERKAAFSATDDTSSNEHAARAEKLNQQLETFRGVLRRGRADLDAARTDRDGVFSAGSATNGVKGRIVDELAKHPKPRPDGSPARNGAKDPDPRYRVVTSTALPFYEPSEPLVAVSGAAMARLNTAEPSRPLACRDSGQVVTGMALKLVGGGLVTVKAEALLKNAASEKARKRLGGLHTSLLGEALLLDGDQALAIAREVSQEDPSALMETVRALQDPRSTEAQRRSVEPNTLIGRLPAPIAAFAWERNPWVPLLLAWEVSWQSDYVPRAGQPLQEDLVARRWRLDRSGDLVRDEAAEESASTRYRGYSILTGSASAGLAERLKKLAGPHPLVGELASQRVLLQKLDGFNDALLLQRPVLQIPPLDFSKWRSSRGKYYLHQVHADLTGEPAQAGGRNPCRTAPAPAGDPFLPIRSGRLVIEKLSVIDAFGQTLKLPVEEINKSAGTGASMLHVARSCTAGTGRPAERPGARSAIEIPPRFAQPMRLRFEGAVTSGAPSTAGGPVCGWILPNHLEKSLAIYSAEGSPLGVLQKRLGQVSGAPSEHAFFWVDVPGVQDGSGARALGDPGERLASGRSLRTNRDAAEWLAPIVADAHLRHFCAWALGLGPEDGAVFSTRLSERLATTDERVPEEDPGVSVLVGRPLALVRASLRLEAAGLPAHRPELRAEEGTDVASLIDTGGFERLEWPLRLGDSGARDDGLLGLFRCSAAIGGGVIAGGAFYPAWGHDADRSASGVKRFAAQDFSVDCVRPLEVALLMDPQARVHATTGALPRTHFELPQESVSGATRVREVFFQTAPVLGFSPTPEMPRPSDDYGEWSWACRPDVNHWKLDPALVEATERGGFANPWPSIAEGWLKLVIAPVKVVSLWLREPTTAVAPRAQVHLAWRVQHAESLRLVTVDGEGNEGECLGRWDTPPFPSGYPATVEAKTVYRIIATGKGARDAKDLTIDIEASQKDVRA